MATIISLNEKIQINSITYEAGDQIVKADCVVYGGNGETHETTLMISHTDLNRIIARVYAMGYEFETSDSSHIVLNDGTQIYDYSFENLFGESIVLEEFQFMNEVREIRA